MPHEQAPFAEAPQVAEIPEADPVPQLQPHEPPAKRWTPEQAANVEAVARDPVAMGILMSQARHFANDLSPPIDEWDLAQETLARIPRSPGFTSENAAPWLRKVARHKAIDLHRAGGTRPQTTPLHGFEESELYTSPEPGPHDIVESRMMVNGIFEKLSEEHCTVLRMYYLKDMSIETIAEKLSINPGTVKSRLFYAKKRAQRVATKKLGLTKADIF